jgi:hypothetical protein
MTDQAAIPAEIQPLLDDFVSALRRDVPDLVSAVYLQGSIALGAFQSRFSDIDFIAVLSRIATATDLASLAKIHHDIQSHFLKWKLEGTYVQAADFQKSPESIGPSPSIHDGCFEPAATNTLDDVSWWLLKTRGVTLFGPDPRTLTYGVQWDSLISNMHHNMNTYWKLFTTNPTRIAWMLAEWGIQWTVLGVLRQYYTFCENDITSKIGAGEYALTHLPARWHKIIQEAVNIRNERPTRLYRSPLTRAYDAWQLLRYVISQNQ